MDTVPAVSASQRCLICWMLIPVCVGANPFRVRLPPRMRRRWLSITCGLEVSWDLGAAGWSAQQRRNFANDTRNLLATTATANAATAEPQRLPRQPLSDEFACTQLTLAEDPFG